MLGDEERMIFRHCVLSNGSETMFDKGGEVTPKAAYYVYLDNGGVKVSEHKNCINSRTDIIGILSAYANPVYIKGKHCIYHVHLPKGLRKPRYLVRSPASAKGIEIRDSQLYFDLGEEVKLVRNVKNGLEENIVFRIDDYYALYKSEEEQREERRLELIRKRLKLGFYYYRF